MRLSKCHLLTLSLSTLLLAGRANAGIVLNFFPGSDFNANAAIMDSALGITGFTVDNFETTTLIPGLTITLSGSVTTTVWTALPGLFNENTCAPFAQNQAWDGANTATNATGNTPNSCTTPSNIAKSTTFDYASGASSLGLGLSDFQSVNPPSPFAPVTNHELFVNGIDEGVLETLAGGAWSPGLTRNAYLRVDGTHGTRITSVEVENLSSAVPLDFLMFDRLAVQPAAVPEPATPIACFLLLLAILSVRRYSTFASSRH